MDLSKFLEMLTLYRYNMKVVHWNSVGDQFDRIHQLADKYYESIGETQDTIGEMIGMLDGDIPSLLDVISDLKDSDKQFVVVSGNSKYTYESGVILFQQMLSDIVEGVEDLLSEVDPEDTSICGIKSTLEAIQYDYAKERDYFNRRRGPVAVVAADEPDEPDDGDEGDEGDDE